MDAEALLRRWGFFAHPFRETTAEHQRNAAQIFVMPPYFGDIVGDRESPRSALIFGSRGDGKSALKAAVKDAFLMTPRKFIIAEYSDFSPFTDPDSITKIDSDLHLRRILQIVSNHLLSELESDTLQITKLTPEQRAQLQWHFLLFPPDGHTRTGDRRWLRILNSLPQSRGLGKSLWRAARNTGGYLRRKRLEVDTSGDESVVLSVAKFALAFLAPAMPTSKQLTSQDKLQSFRELLPILNLIGIDGIIILVDRLDETPLIARRPDLMADLIKPLLFLTPFLELDGVATKFFLPSQVFVDLRRHIRTDRILTRHISWSDNTLKEVLRRRLLSYSDSRIESLTEFIEADTQEDFERALCYYSAQNPRNLLRILDSIITELCNIYESPAKIDRVGLEAGIREFLRIRTSEGDAGEYEGRLRERPEEPPFGRTRGSAPGAAGS